MNNDDYRFDIDLAFGVDVECKFKRAIEGTVEVKADRIARTTGNIAIEYRSRGKRSGISTSEAKHWTFSIIGPNDEPMAYITIPTRRLRALAAEQYFEGRITKGGDNNTSEMVLIPILELFT